jgi:hypothetical protein
MSRLNIEILREIYHSIKQNRMRAVLSGCDISWGILILLVLLGTGKGFQIAVKQFGQNVLFCKEVKESGLV